MPPGSLAPGGLLFFHDLEAYQYGPLRLVLHTSVSPTLALYDKTTRFGKHSGKGLPCCQPGINPSDDKVLHPRPAQIVQQLVVAALFPVARLLI